jgi:hypothetical protein
MKISNVLLFFIILILTLALSETNAFSSYDIALDMNSLPSAQGWTYVGNVLESNAFSVSGGILHQNTIDPNGNSETAAYYIQNANLVNSSFVFNMVARLNSEQFTGPANAYACDVQINTGSEYIGFGLGARHIQVIAGISNSQGHEIAYDTSQFHDYTVAFNSNTNIWTLSADGTLIATEPAMPNATGMTNVISFGDGTAGPNANADYASFSFVQGDATPIPPTVWLFGSGLAGLLVLKRKYIG